MTYSIIIDLLLLAVLILTVLRYRKKGFFAGVCELLGNLIAAVGAYFAAGHISASLFENFFKTGLVNQVSQTVSETAGAIKTSEIIETLFSFLPKNIAETLWKQADQIIEISQASTYEAAAQVVDAIVAPVVVPLIAIVVFFALFILGRLLITFLVAALTNLNKVPVLGRVNKILGAIVGLLSGGINIYILTCVLGALSLVTAGGLPFVTKQVLEKSVFCGLFLAYNPFL